MIETKKMRLTYEFDSYNLYILCLHPFGFSIDIRAQKETMYICIYIAKGNNCHTKNVF